MVRVLYFGTTIYAARVLKTLASAQGFSVVGVVTQPGRPKGRSQTAEASPVATAAQELGIPVLEPSTLSNFDTSLLPSADVFVVFAYGVIIPKKILDLPLHGALNIHPSLLPKYRGPTPVQTAILNGDATTGITIIQLDEKMDHGPIVYQQTMPIDANDTADTLTDKLVARIEPELPKLVAEWVAGSITAQEQNESESTVCKMLTREDGKIHWQKTATEIYNQYRALTPWPGVWTEWNGKRLKLFDITANAENLASGSVVCTNGVVYIGTKTGSIAVQSLQIEGGTKQNAQAFVNGHHGFVGSKLA